MKLIKKIRTALSMGSPSWKWAYVFYKKRAIFLLSYSRSLLLRRKHWKVSVGGIQVLLCFHTSYHHQIARRLYNGCYEWDILKWWVKRAKSARTVYDVGGFNGIYGMLAAKANPGATVLIFEPDPVNVKHIEENIRINNLINCTLMKMALSNTRGVMSFTGDGTTGGKIREDGKVKVVVGILDDFPGPDLIKIDVEGEETRVLQGGISALSRIPDMVLEIGLKNTEHPQEISALLCKNGYKLPEHILVGNYVTEESASYRTKHLIYAP